MKKLLVITLSFVLVLGLMGCGGKQDHSPLSEKETTSMLTNANDFKGRTVENLPVRLFNVITEEEGNYQYQAWTDEDSNKPILIDSDTNLNLNEGDYALISGTVAGTKKYETMIGKTEAPLIKDASATISDFSIFNEAGTTVDVNETINQEGIDVTLEKIEFANSSTRVYFTINNGSSDAISVYSFNSFILQGSTQYDESSVSYEENTLKNELQAGVTTEGRLSFEKMEDPNTPFSVTLEVFSDNYNTELSPFTFEVTP